MTDDGLAHLARLTGLSSLYVGQTGITDAGLAHLAGLTGLKSLWIDGTKVSDAGLRHLEGLRGSGEVVAYHTQVTDAGKSRILKALPNLNIYTFFPDETDAAAKAEKPPEAGGDGGVGSKGRLFTPDGKLVYVNVYSTAPDADRKDLVKFANDVVMPRLRRIKGMEVPRDLANGPLRRAGPAEPRPDAGPQPVVRGHHRATRQRPSGMILPGDELDEAMGKVIGQSKANELIVIWPSNKADNYEFIVLETSRDGEHLPATQRRRPGGAGPPVLRYFLGRRRASRDGDRPQAPPRLERRHRDRGD